MCRLPIRKSEAGLETFCECCETRSRDDGAGNGGQRDPTQTNPHPLKSHPHQFPFRRPPPRCHPDPRRIRIRCPRRPGHRRYPSR